MVIWGVGGLVLGGPMDGHRSRKHGGTGLAALADMLDELFRFRLVQ